MILRTAAALSLAAWPALAQSTDVQVAAADPVAADVQAIYDGLRLPGIIDVMSREGVLRGAELGEQIFAPRPVPDDWTAVVADIYDTAHMESEVLASLADSFADQDTGPIRAFLEAEPGRTLMALELSTREAMLDEGAEQEAKEAAAVAVHDNDPRVALIDRYAEALDLVEMNVAGTMNTSVAYLTALLDGGAMREGMTETDILTDVWTQEPQIRADAEEWVYSFLLKAYGPASDADLETLIAFSETEAGQALNEAVFAAFNDRFLDISRALGLAAARYMTTDEI